jgi:hypothetical protein
MVVDAEGRLLLHHNAKHAGVTVEDGQFVVDEDAFTQLCEMGRKDAVHARQTHQFGFLVNVAVCWVMMMQR